MPYTKNEIIAILKEHKPILFAKYPLSSLGLFGSFARGDNKENSDIDILVDFKDRIDGFDYIRLAHEFEDLFSHKIDMVSRRAINRRLFTICGALPDLCLNEIQLFFSLTSIAPFLNIGLYC